MGKRQPPTPPYPKSIASMQLAGNIGSSIANISRDNINQITPDGTLHYNQIGTNKITDPYTGSEISIPQYARTYSLNPLSQEIHDKYNLNKRYLSDILTQHLNTFAQKNNNHVNNTQSFDIPKFQADLSQEKKDDLLHKNANIIYDYGNSGGENYEKTLFSRLEPHLQQDRQSL
ncbi:hypothetical protein [Candidatus Liberibacter americanus]|uniref:Uncharacterized protein n=1 Tax=Candidatus Liberibacter americanus str. Sao Paulo TaxID=1261131 RepID=U6B470_9HYPH|nr:hypothetical protein [Candidatus Liberibacter americanus]AHA27859.1 hypothetical protein lam_500 [Candidatus Liberibacter americanus str. Sao Paulo]